MPDGVPGRYAAALIAARRSGHPARSADLPELADPGAAYAVQDAVGQACGGFGSAMPRHWKSGASGPGAIATHAPLLPDGIAIGIPGQPADLTDRRFHGRGIEAELALRLAVDVSAEQAAALRLDQVPELIAAWLVTIEVVDSRWQEGAGASPLSRLADFQSHGALVVGDSIRYRTLDARQLSCAVRIGSGDAAGPAVRFTGSHSLGDPLAVVPGWLRHATRDGGVVPAGTLVTTGTWCGLLAAAPGQRVEVEFDGIGGAAVQL